LPQAEIMKLEKALLDLEQVADVAELMPLVSARQAERRTAVTASA
jgi:hypothetical protein